MLVAKHMGCMHQALACLAHLASHRPRSPCLHQQQQQRRSAPPGRRRRPGCCCEVQARRARPIRGEVSQARQGQGPSRFFFYSAYLGPGPFIWPMAWSLHGFFYLRGPCTKFGRDALCQAFVSLYLKLALGPSVRRNGFATGP